MLIRSGLIKNFDQVDTEAFTRHWRDVHGPIAARLPHLRGYVQNHIVERGEAGNSHLIHRIDGISQLWFDDVDSMGAAFDSPEQDACVADISGFLDKVTLAIQSPGDWRGTAGPAPEDGAKLLAVYVGEGSAAEIAAGVSTAFETGGDGPTRYRINPVIAGDFIVDPTIARDEAPIVAVLEAVFSDRDARRRAIAAGVLNAASPLAPAAVIGVERSVFIRPPE